MKDLPVTVSTILWWQGNETVGELGLASNRRKLLQDGHHADGAEHLEVGAAAAHQFKLKSDAKATLQYGLITEEVAKVYPELVIRDKNGRVDGVLDRAYLRWIRNQLAT